MRWKGCESLICRERWETTPASCLPNSAQTWCLSSLQAAPRFAMKAPSWMTVPVWSEAWHLRTTTPANEASRST
ncbi:hypothetical protein D9M68_996210 [compost metagenome]